MLTYLILTLLFLLSLIIVLFVLNRYTNYRRVSPGVLAIIVISWTFPFSAFFLLPIDLISTGYDNCIKQQLMEAQKECLIPWLYVDNLSLYVIWRVVYWSSFCLNWIIIPIMERYLDLGGFNWKRKLRKAIKNQLIYISLLGGIGIVFVAYIVVKQKLNSYEATKGYLIAISNCWGLILIIGFMGYGLVDVPFKLWKASFPMKRLNRLEIEAPVAKEKLLDSEHELKEAFELLQLTSSKINLQHPLRKELDTILNQLNFDMESFHDMPLSNRINNNIPSVIDEKYLDNIHLKLKRNLKLKERNLALWDELLNEAFLVQDILNCKNNSDRKLTSELTILSGSKYDDFKISFLWWYHIYIIPTILRVLTFICILLSIVVLWSELTFKFNKIPLSIIALMFHSLQGNNSILQIICALFIIFMSYCAYSTLFQIKIFNYYVLVPNQHTDSISLLLCGEYLCKLAIPLYYNFLMLANLDQKTNSVFMQLMGSMNLIPFLGMTFNQLFPFFIMIPVCFALFGWHKKILNYFSLDSILYDDFDSPERIRQGRDILKNERVKQERRIQFSNSGLERTTLDNNLNPSRSMAVEVTNEHDNSFYDSDDSDNNNDDNQLSTSQKVRKFFSNWKFATISDQRSTSPNAYTNINQYDDDIDDEEDIGYLRSIRNDS